MSKLKALSKQVEQILKDYPMARQDDRFLITAVYIKYYRVPKGESFVAVMKDHTLPPFESIRRARQKIQETNMELRGDAESEKIRMMLQEEYIAYARGEES